MGSSPQAHPPVGEPAVASANPDGETWGLQPPQPIRMWRHDASANQDVETRGCSCLSQSACWTRSTLSLLQLRDTRSLQRSQPIRGGRSEAQPIRAFRLSWRTAGGMSPLGNVPHPACGWCQPGAVGGLHPWRHPQPGRGLGPLALGDTAGAAPGAGNPQRSPSSNAVFSPQRERFCHQKGAICDQNS